MFSANQTAEIVACILSLQKALGKLTNAKNVLLQLAIYSLMFFWHLIKVYVCVCVSGWLALCLSVCLSVWKWPPLLVASPHGVTLRNEKHWRLA